MIARRGTITVQERLSKFHEHRLEEKEKNLSENKQSGGKRLVEMA